MATFSLPPQLIEAKGTLSQHTQMLTELNEWESKQHNREALLLGMSSWFYMTVIFFSLFYIVHVPLPSLCLLFFMFLLTIISLLFLPPLPLSLSLSAGGNLSGQRVRICSVQQHLSWITGTVISHNLQTRVSERRESEIMLRWVREGSVLARRGERLSNNLTELFMSLLFLSIFEGDISSASSLSLCLPLSLSLSLSLV